MNETRNETVIGVFDDRASARRAVDELRRMGFREDQIGAAHRADGTDLGTPPFDEPPRDASKWEEGAATGVAAGLGIGALWALGIAVGLLPGLGPVVAGGILGSLLASAAGGAAIGGIVGALVGLGLPENEARYYESEFLRGRTLVTVRGADRADQARDVLRRHGAYDIHSGRPTAPAAAGSRQVMTGCCGGGACEPNTSVRSPSHSEAGLAQQPTGTRR